MKTADKELQKALSSFKKKYPKSDSGDLQTFILGWRAMEEYANQPAVSEEEIEKEAESYLQKQGTFRYTKECKWDFKQGVKWFQSLNVQGETKAIQKQDGTYHLSCQNCGTTSKPLQIIPLRDNHHVVGMIMSCDNCKDILYGQKFDREIKLPPQEK